MLVINSIPFSLQCQTLHILKPEERIGVQELSDRITVGPDKCLVLDVRLSVEFDICRLPNSISILLCIE